MSLSVDEGKALVTEFCKSYPSALQVRYKIRSTQEELFNAKETIESAGKIFGAYFPASNIAGFATSNFRDENEFKDTLRHEILGHFGLNTFNAEEKRLIVTAIANAKDQPGLADLWAGIDSWYPNTPELLKAEEVYAFACEAIDPNRLANTALGENALREVCFDKTRPMQLNDLINITNLVADGMRQGVRQQQNFPLTDQEQFKRGTDMEPKKPFHEVVAENLIKQLETNTAPWQKPWEPGQGGFLPINPTTGNRYKGINAIQLMSQNHEDNRWMTYKQAEAVGAQVRKGEKGTPVQYWKFSEEQTKRDDQGKPVLDGNNQPVKEIVQLERPRVFMATVFNAEQIDGLPPLQIKEPVQSWEANDRAETILAASGANINHSDSNRAFYRSSTDSIHMPEKHQFPTEGNYYATALHELGHWTGHESRLNRDLGNPFGSEAYAKEELRAEIASMILGDELGIGHDPEQHVSYVKSWINVLKQDPMEIFRAAADAEKIQGFVLAFENQQNLSIEQQLGTGLNSDINLVLQDNHLTFDHFVSFDRAPLEDVLRENGLTSISSITGNDPHKFYETALERLSPVFGIPIDYNRTDNAYLERKGLVQAFSNQAESLHRAILEQEKQTMAPKYDTPQVVKIANDPNLHGENSGGFVVVSGDSKDQLAGPFSSDLDAEAARQHLIAELKKMELEIEFGVTVPGKWNGVAEIVSDGENQFVVVGHLSDGGRVTIGEHNDHYDAQKQKDLLELLSMHVSDIDSDLESAIRSIDAQRTEREFLASQKEANRNVALPPKVFQLADEPETYGEKAGWFLVVSADEERELSIPFATEEEADIERHRVFSQMKFEEGFKNKFFDDWLDEHSSLAFGFEVPHEWNGNVQFRGNIVEEGNGERYVLTASERGVEPQFYSLYAQLNDGTHAILADYDSLDEALTVKENLETVGANLEENELERAAKLARIHEERVRRDPASTDDQIIEAKENRKDAEMSAMLNDAALQKEIAETTKRYQQLADEVNAETKKDTAKEIIYIKVPYAEKEEVKALGAKWDRKEQSWYIPPGLTPESFAKWTPAAPQIAPAAISEPSQGIPTGASDKPDSERVYLAVPYGERDAAKLAGAQWDKKAKSWYVGDNPDTDLIKRWLPENVTAQQGPAKTPQEEFADALRSVGCIVPPGSEHPIMDGKKHRIETAGDKNGEKAGFYVGHLDGHPAGYIKNNKTSVDMRWKSKGYSLSEEDKAKLNAEAATKLAQRDANQDRTQLQTSSRIENQMASLVPITQPTPYLAEKGIQAHTGALTDTKGKTTFIPAQDINGKVWTMQYIAEDGTKRFAKDSKKEGCFHVVGGMDALAKAPAIVVGEGYATATTASESLGFATVAAFDSGNLSKVVKDLHEKFPDKPVIVIGDDDRHLSMTQGVNVGKEKAIAAAKEVGGKAIFPVFTPKEQSYPTELPPITPEKYRKNEISTEQREALATIKKFTDFNDLSTKSELGKEGVHRQLNTAVNKVIEDTIKHRESQALEASRKAPGAKLDQELEVTKKRAPKIS